MKNRTTFSRLMLGNVIIILLCLALMFTITYFSVRDEQIKSRMETLKIHAYDIARLTKSVSVWPESVSITSSSRQFLHDKLYMLYEEYDAYCLVVNRSGRVVSFFLSILEEHSELKANFDADNIINTLQNVLRGDEITVQNNTKDGPMFTLAIPMLSGNSIIGAVYIQTAAQNVKQAYTNISIIIAISGLIIFALAALISLYFHKQLTVPLADMAKAASDLSLGNFATRVDSRGTKEMVELSNAFNIMSQKLEENETVRRDFIANVSHELSSPLTSIRGFIQGILDGTIEEEKAAQYLQIVLDETDRLSTIVSSLLKLSRMQSDEALNISRFDIHEMIRLVVITNMNKLESKKQEIILNFDETPLYIKADKDKIEQVLINLVDNAIKYTPENGHISILTKDIQNDKITVTVKDNGIGILDEDIPYVFDRFYMAEKAHTSGKGTGLGLAICKTIIEKHGEKIWLESSSGGTAFSFTIKKAEKQ